jgi:hypothetical protein
MGIVYHHSGYESAYFQILFLMGSQHRGGKVTMESVMNRNRRWYNSALMIILLLALSFFLPSAIDLHGFTFLHASVADFQIPSRVDS